MYHKCYFSCSSTSRTHNRLLLLWNKPVICNVRSCDWISALVSAHLTELHHLLYWLLILMKMNVLLTYFQCDRPSGWTTLAVVCSEKSQPRSSGERSVGHLSMRREHQGSLDRPTTSQTVWHDCMYCSVMIVLLFVLFYIYPVQWQVKLFAGYYGHPYVVMGGHYILQLWFLSSVFFFFSSPVLSGRRLDVYHTSTHDVVLVQIWNACLKCAARWAHWKYGTQKLHN